MQKNILPININKKGFSLVELSIVLVVAGLAIAAIASGAHLIQAAKINKTVAEITGYVTAINDFRDKYKALPGDLPDATSYWGAATANGDGSELIIYSAESLRAWQQLSLSGLIAGNYNGADAGTPDYQAGINVPASNSAAAGSYYFVSGVNPGSVFATGGNALQLGSSDSNTSPWGGALNSADTHIIDVKIDDGIASTGNFYGLRSNIYLATAGKCVDADYSAGSANYILTDSTASSCRIWYWLNKT